MDTLIDAAKEEIETGEKLSQEVGDVTSVAAAGFDTAGTSLAWLLYYLTIYPKIQDKVAAELKSVLSDNDINEESIKKLT